MLAHNYRIFSMNKIRKELEAIAAYDESLWRELEGKKIFATGCTSFIGTWIIYSFIHLNEKFGLGAKLTILTRSEAKFRAKFPEASSIAVVEGDVRNFPLPSAEYDYLIHGATDVSSFQTGSNQSELIDVAYLGTKRVLALKAKRALILSSGAVYGDMPLHANETYSGGPLTNSAKAAYGEAKRITEVMMFNEPGLSTSSARIFAASGPFLPMDSTYAFANFLKNCLDVQTIQINGNGLTTRSYLYGSDLVLWLWIILIRGDKNGIYNVGSDEEVSIKELAFKMAKVFGGDVSVLGKDPGFSRYVPSNAKMKKFNVPTPVSLDEAILRCKEFYQC